MILTVPIEAVTKVAESGDFLTGYAKIYFVGTLFIIAIMGYVIKVLFGINNQDKATIIKIGTDSIIASDKVANALDNIGKDLKENTIVYKELIGVIRKSKIV